jgi:O-succinylbenzoic acid--CoA ligase
MLALPLDYIAGLMVLVRTAEAGRMPVEFTAPRFDAAEFCRAVRELHDDTWFTALVPAQLVRLVEFAETDTDARDALRRFERILVGGQAIPDGLVDRANDLGVRVTKTYGSAETAGGVVYDGTPIGDTEVRIVSDGQIELSTSSLALGYLADSGMVTPWSFSTEDGRRWWHTTDVGVVQDGVLTVVGRTDDVIVTGGIKVALGDIDRVLDAAGVNAVASWFADDTWGQVPAIVSETELDRDAVRDLIEREVSTEARPYRFVTVPELPRLSSGKIDRRAVHGLVANVES